MYTGGQEPGFPLATIKLILTPYCWFVLRESGWGGGISCGPPIIHTVPPSVTPHGVLGDFDEAEVVVAVVDV